MGETKFRKKMYKSGKFWVAAGMTALTVGVVGAQRVGLPVFTDGLQERRRQQRLHRR
ncbi:KxYKxGKxW signal peptide domain-containing protein [Weissella cibaria]|uniref:KxYKxGKxW signal peptide domain-containing protein n=1 Tax=Weissella cibaria TaxID=137591 RepID=UPI001EEE258F|nr:KxYKxGKxW signal peptide domain-containing protein [Weissella cibaria]MCG4286160.1 KxYKxGKxW signal peptide domain-containing protein [Weissella cibaria]